jgi:Spy/CpxP family protein refolding chaperone
MVRSLRFVLVALAICALCNSAWAQPGPRGGGRGPGRGFTPSMSMMYPMLLGSQTVQKDLDLVDEQKAKLKELSEKNRAAMRELFSSGGDMRDMTDEERAEVRKKMQTQMEANQKAVLGVLLPDQLKRLKGIALQQMGAMALADKDVQKELKMTDDQVAKIKSAGEDAMKKMGELRDITDRQERRKKAEELRKEGEKKAMDVLTADQKAQFDKMKGKEIKIPQEEMFRGMGGRRGGRGPGGGPGGPGGNNRPVD